MRDSEFQAHQDMSQRARAVIRQNARPPVEEAALGRILKTAALLALFAAIGAMMAY